MDETSELYSEADIVDPLEDDDQIVPLRYSISSYGADYPVDSLVGRLQSDAIYIPSFQREFVWNVKQSSRFIESLLLGLPVPGVFLSRDTRTQQLVVVDGQQRLRSLQAFYEGVFPPSRREFALIGVQPEFLGKTYKTLPSESRLLLDDSIIHATIIKQDEPSDDESSIYNVFERLNTGATPLTAQEIRASIYHGPFSDLLKGLNDNHAWRETFFRPINKRRRDQELILRFFALYFNRNNYRRPMQEFLNEFMGKNRFLTAIPEDDFQAAFVPTIELLFRELGGKVFKPQRSFNAAAFDSIMIGVASALQEQDEVPRERLIDGYERLIQNPFYLEAILKATADPISLHQRISLAIEAFGAQE